jgi:ABC-type Fe3+-hydroxamate transport system substrate-binding protein
MAWLERRVQVLEKGGREAYEEWEKKWEAIEARLGGFPKKKHYLAVAGPYDMNTVVWEREWESFAVMEAAYDRLFEDPEQVGDSTVVSERIEYYWVME